MSDRQLHEVVLEAAPEIEHRTANWARERGEKWQGRNIGPELAAVLKAAEELANLGHGQSVAAYDAACADLRRVLEGK